MVRTLKDSLTKYSLPTKRERTENANILRPLFLASTAFVSTNARNQSIL